MTIASYQKKVEVSTDGGTNWNLLPTFTASLERPRELLDATKQGGVPDRDRTPSLRDWSITCEAYLEESNTALAAVIDANREGTTLMVRYLPTGNVDILGIKGNCLVESVSESGSVDGQETLTITFQAKLGYTAANA